MHNMALMQPEGDGCAAPQEEGDFKDVSPAAAVTALGGTSELKAAMFNCSIALSPAQHLAKQVCSQGVMVSQL